MKKKINVNVDVSDEKDKKTFIKDINDPIEAAIEPKSEGKEHFSRFRRFNQKREENTAKYHKFNSLLMLVFPIFICFMAEINQGKYIKPFLVFAADRPTVILFDILLTRSRAIH